MAKRFKIPKTIHYCFGLRADFGGMPWGLSHYACVRSAIERIRPERVLLYYEHEPTGEWWDLTRPLLDLVHIRAPREIFGNVVEHPAHRADVVRLERLLDEGGIYLDADVLVHRSFDDLLSQSVVMGAEGRDSSWGVANAVILAEPGAAFLRRWYETYRSFRGAPGRYWNEHSVVIPSQLAQRHPDEIRILPYDAFYWPLWSEAHLRWMFESARPIETLPHAYANHLWEQKAKRYLLGLTPGEVRARDTNFHSWVQPFVAGLPDEFGADAAEPPERKMGLGEIMLGPPRMQARRMLRLLKGA